MTVIERGLWIRSGPPFWRLIAVALEMRDRPEQHQQHDGDGHA